MPFGVTKNMIDAYGETIFEMSLNMQHRYRDPVRTLDFDALDEQQVDRGLTDTEIAGRLGLTVEQTRYIRTVVERRKYRPNQYKKLFQLGAGKRWRPERYRDRAAEQSFSKSAQAVRDAMTFDPERTQYYVRNGWWRNETVYGWIRAQAERHPDQAAILTENETITYDALREKAEALAGGLYELGLRRGDVIAAQLPNTLEMLLLYAASGRLGLVLSTIHMPYDRRDIKALLHHSRARAVVCLDNFKDAKPAALMLDLRGKLEMLDHVIVIGAAPDGAVDFSALAGSGDCPAMPDPAVGTDPAVLMYTSGTTDAPKAVPLKHQNFLSNARLNAPEFAITDEDIILSAAPFSHMYGLYAFHLAIVTGAIIALLPVFSGDGMCDAVNRFKPSIVVAAPAHAAAWLESDRFGSCDRTGIRLVVLSGAALPEQLAYALDDQLPNAAIVQLWGMTEVQAGLFTRPGDAIDIAAHSVGRACPGNEIRIDESGELLIRGCSVFPGYFDNQDATRAAITDDGWFRTGDTASIGEDGNIRITGRIKDIINRGGYKFNPREVEELIEAYPGIERCAIVPVADQRLGERAKCIVTVSDGEEGPTLQEICAYLSDQGVSKRNLPEALAIADAMPMTPTGKVIKGELT